jgi:hypothetical protein
MAQQLLPLPPDVLTRTLELFREVTAELPLPQTPYTTEIVSAAAA